MKLDTPTYSLEAKVELILYSHLLFSSFLEVIFIKVTDHSLGLLHKYMSFESRSLLSYRCKPFHVSSILQKFCNVFRISVHIQCMRDNN